MSLFEKSRGMYFFVVAGCFSVLLGCSSEEQNEEIYFPSGVGEIQFIGNTDMGRHYQVDCPGVSVGSVLEWYEGEGFKVNRGRGGVCTAVNKKGIYAVIKKDNLSGAEGSIVELWYFDDAM